MILETISRLRFSAKEKDLYNLVSPSKVKYFRVTLDVGSVLIICQLLFCAHLNWVFC